MKKVALSGIAVIFLAVSSYGQLWTASVIFNVTTGGKAQRALIWIPPSAAGPGIRGLIMAGQTSSEYPFTRDPAIRETAEAERLAIIHFYPSGLGGLQASDTTLILRALDMLAAATGFNEIKTAPWITFGHSAGSAFTLYLAYWKPERTIATIVHKGGLLPKPAWGRNIDHVPVLTIQGQFEEFGGTYPTDEVGDSSFIKCVRDVLSLRAASPDKHLVAPAICGGEGHMGYSKRAQPLISLFIKKAVARRVPESGTALRNLPAEAGWLAASDLREKKGAVTIDTFPKLSAPSSRFWLIDREFAQAWLEFHKELTKTRQRVCPNAQKPLISPAPPRALTYATSGKLFDGRFYIGFEYAITAQSSSGLPVSLVLQAGPGVVNGNKFFINPCAHIDETTIRLLLRNDGNETYSVGDRMIKASPLTRPGTAQVLTIKQNYPVANVGDVILLEGKSDSDLPVYYDVFSGPGILDGNKLTIKPFVSRTETATIILRAGQGGNSTFTPATVVEWSITVKNPGVVVRQTFQTGRISSPAERFRVVTLSGRILKEVTSRGTLSTVYIKKDLGVPVLFFGQPESVER